MAISSNDGGAVVLHVARTGTTLVLALAPAVAVYFWQTRVVRRRRAILWESFPPEWEVVLQRDVVFFRILEPAAQQRFRRQLQVFLGEKQVSGIKVEVDATTRVLVAASAIIPVFGPDFRFGRGTLPRRTGVAP